MIERLYIQNFQSHKDTQLDFHKGVNCIIGPSDSGKSAVMRALLWPITNRPTGESFRSTWGGKTTVGITLDDGEVIRSRDKNSNRYFFADVVGQDTEDGEELTAFGQDVPVEVSKLLNLGEVNIQRQLDSPFLLSETAGEVARQLNAIANLDIIDTATVNIAREVRQYADNEKTHSQELYRINEEMKQYDDLPDQEAMLAAIEKQDAVLAEKKTQHLDLTVLTARIIKLEQDVAALGDVSRMIKLSEELDALSEALTRKQGIIRGVSLVLDGIRSQEVALKQLLPVAEAEAGLLLIRSFTSGLDHRSKFAGDLIRLVEQTKEMLDQLGVSGADVEKLEKEFCKLMPDKCPLCGRSGGVE